MRGFYYPETIQDWEANLLQTGGRLPAYSGVAYQRGQGIGSFFKGLFRAIWPTVKKAGITAGKEAIQAGSEATRDYLNEGVDFKTAIKRRGKHALGRTVSSLGRHLQDGKGVGHRAVRKSIKGFKRGHRVVRKSIKEFKRRRKQKKDIFKHG